MNRLDGTLRDSSLPLDFGDGFTALFGAPLVADNICENAVRAARQILNQVENSAAAGEIPPTRIGLGLHAGPALGGNIGSAERREYTVIGDVVNVAFRIEKLNKELGSKLLISESVQHAMQAAANDEAPASLQLRGRQGQVRVYKLV
ncbi:MAG: adenylate/guanylate cyclase domain-containing protein [Chthoniobacterales bacterium]